MMKKMAASFFLLGVLAMALSEPPAWAQEKHWLVGIWKGEIADFKAGGGPARTLNVVEVGADGTAQAAFAVGSASATSVGNVKVKVAGDLVSLTTSTNAQAKLKKAGDKLEGNFTAPTGRSYPFQLSRVLPYRFAGRVRGTGTNCGQPLNRDMEVEQIGDSVAGYLDAPNGAARFSGKMDGAGFEAKRISSRNESQTITGKITGDEMAATFDTPGCMFTGTLKKQP